MLQLKACKMCQQSQSDETSQPARQPDSRPAYKTKLNRHTQVLLCCCLCWPYCICTCLLHRIQACMRACMCAAHVSLHCCGAATAGKTRRPSQQPQDVQSTPFHHLCCSAMRGHIPAKTQATLGQLMLLCVHAPSMLRACC